MQLKQKMLKSLDNGKFLLDCVEFGIYYNFKFYSPETKKRGKMKQGNELVHTLAVFKHFLQFGVIEIEYFGYKNTFSYGKQYMTFIKHITNGEKTLAFNTLYPKLKVEIPKNYFSFIDWKILEGGVIVE